MLQYQSSGRARLQRLQVLVHLRDASGIPFSQRALLDEFPSLGDVGRGVQFDTVSCLEISGLSFGPEWPYWLASAAGVSGAFVVAVARTLLAMTRPPAMEKQATLHHTRLEISLFIEVIISTRFRLIQSAPG